MSGHIRSAAAIGVDVFVEPTRVASIAAPYAIGFSPGGLSPPLPASQRGSIRLLISSLSSAVLRTSVPGSKAVSLTSGSGSIVWPPSSNSTSNVSQAPRRLGFAAPPEGDSNSIAPYVLCSPAFAFSAQRYAAPADGGSGAVASIISPLPPCNYPVGDALRDVVAPRASASFPSNIWAAASESAASGGSLVNPTLDAVIFQWGLSAVSGSAGWAGASNAAPTLNARASVGAANNSNQSDSPRALGSGLRRLTPGDSFEAPQPCSSSLVSAIHADRILPSLSDALPDHELDTTTVTVLLSTVNGTPIASWPNSSGATAYIFTPYSAAAILLPNGSSVSAAPAAGLSSLQVWSGTLSIWCLS